MEEDDSKKGTSSFKLKKSEMWKYISILLIILLAISLVYPRIGSGKTVSSKDAADKAVGYINDNLLQPGTTVTLNDVKEKNGLYTINISVNGQEYSSYISKDGSMLFISGIDMTEDIKKPAEAETAPAKEVTKSDKPNVELFVMTHCPFGTQAEKGIIPAMESIKDRADVNIRFVHYFMHGDKEEQETYREVCIREEQGSKFWSYLKCFLNASDSNGCIKSVGIDSAKLDTCMKEKAKDYYAIDSELSKKYGVQGSPTLVINEGQAEFYPRSPATALSIICDSFNTAPTAECSKNLSTENPAPGFGYAASNAVTGAATCG